MDHETDVMEILARANPVPAGGARSTPGEASPLLVDLTTPTAPDPEWVAPIELQEGQEPERQFQLTIVSLAASWWRSSSPSER